MLKTNLVLAGILFYFIASAQALEDAKSLLYHERYQSAASALHHLLAKEPENEQAWYLLTTAYLQQGKVTEVKDTLQKATAKVLQTPLLMSSYGHILLKENKVDSARLQFETALKITKSKKPDVLIEIAKAYLDADTIHTEYAKELLRKAIKKR